MVAKQNERRGFLLPLLILVALPFLCVLTAYAAGLEISSPYLTIRFGPSPSGGPVSSSPELPSTGGGDPGGGNGGLLATPIGVTDSGSCFLNVVCVSAGVQADDPATEGGTELDADVDGNGIGIDDQTGGPDNPGLGIDAELDDDDGLGLDVNGPGNVDAGTGVEDGNVDLDLPQAVEGALTLP